MLDEQRDCFRGQKEFIVISRCSINSDPSQGVEDLETPVTDLPELYPRSVPYRKNHPIHESAHFDTFRYSSSLPWCMFNVLMIEWKGKVAHRVAAGRIHIGAFLEAGLIRKHIHLE